MTAGTLVYQQPGTEAAVIYSLPKHLAPVDEEPVRTTEAKRHSLMFTDLAGGAVWELPKTGPSLLPETPILKRPLTFETAGFTTEYEAAAETKRKSISDVKIEASVKPLLTGDMGKLYETLKAIIITKARSSGISIKQNLLRLWKDPEENTSKIVFEITIVGNARQAMAYWDAIGRSVDSWRDNLPPYLRELLVSGWSFTVYWSENGA